MYNLQDKALMIYNEN